MSAIESAGRVAERLSLPAAADPQTAAALAAGAVARLAGRIDEWARLVQGQGAPGAGPDPARLRAGGDLYDLRGLARELAAAVGASPTEEGRLLRALEDVTRGAALRLFGLAGAPDSVRLADLREAVALAQAPVDLASAGGSVTELIARIETAAARLDQTG